MGLLMLRLCEDMLAKGSALTLPPSPRMIFVVHGAISTGDRSLSDEEAWAGDGAVTIHAATSGTSIWRWELITPATPVGVAAGVISCEKISAELRTLPQGELLLRGDSVGFPPGGCA